MDREGRWLLAFVIALALVTLVALARGEPEHGGPKPATIIATEVAA
jgi:hypothetical protein